MSSLPGKFKCSVFEWFSWPEGITPNSGLTGPNNNNNNIKWFEEYNKDDRCSFMKLDIREFYPSITERELDRALDLAKEYMAIPLDKVETTKHCRKNIAILWG